MKKIILLLLLFAAGLSAFGQKSYVNVCVRDVNDSGGQTILLSGAIPNDMKKYYDYWTDNLSIGDILNMLAVRGFVVEQMSCCSGASSDTATREVVILSKSSTPSSYSEGDVNKDGEVNISDINRLVEIILDIVRDNPSILEKSK